MQPLFYGNTTIGEIPDAWKKVKLDDTLVDSLGGFSCAKQNTVPTGVAHLRPFNVGTDGEVKITYDTLFIPTDFRNDLENFYLQPGDVLYNNTNSVDLVGKTGIVRNPMKVAFSNHINRLRVKNAEQIDPRWLALSLRSLQNRGFFATHCNKWIGQAGFSISSLADVEIPLPSLVEQRRIVARIEALFAELRACRVLNEKIQASTNRLVESLLVEIFPSVHEPMPCGWTLQQIKDIADKPQYGYTQSAKQEPVGPKFLRITDIQEGKVDWTSVPFCECDQNAFQKYRLIDKDIVFARSGATTGKTFLVKSPPQAVFASYLIRLKIRKALPEYVSWFFQSRDYWKQITPIGAAIPNMNAQVLQEIRIPIPDSESTQRLIVERCRQFQDEVSEMVRTQAGDSIILDKVEQSILAQAFRGEL